MSSKKFAAFDLDGTLIRWQLYHALVDRLAKRGFLGEGVYEALQESRMRWKKREDEEGFYNYEMDLVQAFDKTASQVDVSIFEQIVEEVFEQYKDQVYTFTRDLIKKLKKEGYFIMAISGSNSELVEKIADYYGFDAFEGTRFAREGTKLQPDPFVASHHKEELLRASIAQHGLSMEGSYAVGDTSSDAPMLAMVENPIAFNPDKKLHALAQQNGWRVVVERKNVVYEL